MTDGQLRSKRDEFWDTAPAFEGRKEIWDALKAAAYAVEANDHGLAQAIIDGAGVTLPHGMLGEPGLSFSIPVCSARQKQCLILWISHVITVLLCYSYQTIHLKCNMCVQLIFVCKRL